MDQQIQHTNPFFSELSQTLVKIITRQDETLVYLNNLDKRLVEVEKKLHAQELWNKRLENFTDFNEHPDCDYSKKIPELKALIQTAIDTRNWAEADRLNGIVKEKNQAYEALQNWDEVTRYVKMKQNKEVVDVKQYLALNLRPIYKKKKFDNKGKPQNQKGNPNNKTTNNYIAPLIEKLEGKYRCHLGIIDRRKVQKGKPSRIHVKDESGEDVKTTSDDLLKIRNVIQDLLSRNIIEKADESKVRLISDIMAIRKKDTIRLTLNFKNLNRNLSKFQPKYISLEDLKNHIGNHFEDAEVVDIKDGFFNIDLHKGDSPFTTFEFEGQKYWFRKLPQGVSNAPYIFDTAMKDALCEFENAHSYMDDILILENSEKSSLIKEKIVKSGFEIGKSTGPTKQFDFIGHRFDLSLNKVSRTQKAFDRLKLKMSKLDLKSLTNRGAYKILSPLVHLFRGKVVPLDLKRKFAEVKITNNNWDEGNYSISEDWINSIIKKAEEPTDIPMIYDSANIKNSIWTDASDNGIGIVIDIGEESKLRVAIPIKNPSWKNLHINDRELIGLGSALKLIPSDEKTRRFKIHTDNPAVYSLLNFKNGGPALSKSLYAAEIHDLILSSNLSYVPSKKDKNDFELDPSMKLADDLSRASKKSMSRSNWKWSIPRALQFKTKNSPFVNTLVL